MPTVTEITQRYTARSAWFCATREVVGLYVQTDAGRVYIAIPTKIWLESIRSDVDGNGHPLPKQRSDEILEQLKRDAEGSSVQVLGAEYSAPKRERHARITPERRHRMREMWLRWNREGKPYGYLKQLSVESGEPYQTLRSYFKYFDAVEVNA